MSRRLTLSCTLFTTFLLTSAGCGPKSEPAAKAKPDGEAPQVEIKKEDVKEKITGATLGPPLVFSASFRDAVRLDPPDGELRPPDFTMGGKNVAKMFEAVSGRDGKPGLWDGVQFSAPDGKKLRHIAHVKTDLGVIKIELFADEAPLHVRNFIALARAGYYDGLCFHRSERTDADDKKDTPAKQFHYLEAGCPKGTGEIGYGSIGYWMKPERTSTKLQHVKGTVGAWHAEELETAACKFYLTLCDVPWMDGNYTIFGKVIQGLEVADAINQRPVHPDALRDRPVEPVVIREVTIHSETVE